MTVYTAPLRCISQPHSYRRVGVDGISFLVELQEGIRFRGYKLRDAFDAQISASGRYLRVEFNPSYATSLSAESPCAFEDLGKVVDAVWAEVSKRAPVSSLPGDARVTRLDLSRDFADVDHARSILEGLRNIPRGRRLKSAAFTNTPAVMWTPNGLTLGGRERVTLYDRHAKNPAVPRGVLRFEARLRSRWLDQAGIRTLTGVSREASVAFLHSKWEWSRFGSPVVSETRFVDAVDRMPWSEGEKAAFFWSETKRLRGLPLAESPRTGAVRRRQRATLGTSAPLYDAASVRLDFGIGTEVVTPIRDQELDDVIEAYAKERGDVL